MTPGWSPSASAPNNAMAIPAERMSFVQDEDGNKNDRILMFSMIGIVLMTALAFGINYFTKQPDQAPPAQPAIAAPQDPPPQQAQDIGQSPRPVMVEPAQTTWTPPPQAPTPTVTQEYTPPSQPAPEPARPHNFQRNRKMNIVDDVTNEN